jgi:hypothetical protein
MTETCKEASMFNILPKKCTRCGEWKNRGEFYDDNRKDNKKRAKDGKKSMCKVCQGEHEAQRIANNPVSKQKHNARTTKWKRAHPQKVAEQSAKWYAANSEHKYNYHVAWLQKNPHRLSAYNRNAKALRKGSNGKITAQEWGELKAKYDFTCLRCGKREPEITLTLDHVLPLSKGGANIIGNAQPLCQPCNSWKHDKHIDYRKDRK